MLDGGGGLGGWEEATLRVWEFITVVVVGVVRDGGVGVGTHKEVRLSVVFLLGRFASMISIASVEVAQRGVRRPCVGLLFRFL